MARISASDCPYHVTHRGNRKAQIFFSDADRLAYLNLLSANAVRFGLRIWAYCLMPNHVHLIVNAARENSMAQCLGLSHRRHARRINERNGWTGHLWANRFYSTPMDDDHLWAAVRYVELNPIRAGLVSDAVQFEWSSARTHATRCRNSLLDIGSPFPGDVDDWRTWLHAGIDDPKIDTLKRNTVTGRPSGSDSFVRELELKTGRRLAPGKRGRPRAALMNDGKPAQRTLSLLAQKASS
jgi:putative transposase